ncbi:unnamed protein product [Phyllotreta striolata]|uniref:Secreted protein n=1 Tax=Phyllotreta striolata TaxID=444603 RepID=A0A9N9XL59_PHYSR|nr:unnamed protein product [Phyllotreta striolata]
MFKVLAICLVGLMACGVQGMYTQNKIGHGLTNCPDQKNPGKLVANEHVQKPYLQNIDIRVPTTGLLEDSISCILIVDNGSTGSDPVIVGGGLGSNFVEIKVPRDLFHFGGLDYKIEVYVNEPTTTAGSSSSAASSPKF